MQYPEDATGSNGNSEGFEYASLVGERWPCTLCDCQNYQGSSHQLECHRASCGHDMIHHHNVKDLLRPEAAVKGVQVGSLFSAKSQTPMQRRTVTFGRASGTPFGPFLPISVGLRGAQLVDAITLNGHQYGGQGGRPTAEENLGREDYWTEFEVRGGNSVDYLRLTSKEGRTVAVGGGGGSGGTFSDLRILAISGRSGVVVDQISIDLVQGYKESALVARDVEFVLDMQTGGSEITVNQEEKTRTFHSYQVVTQQMMTLNVDVSAEIEFLTSFAAKTGLSLTRTQTVLEESTREVTLGRNVKQVLEKDETAFLVGKFDIMKDTGGQGWIIPVTGANWIKMGQERWHELIGKWDLTGGTAAQTNLRTVREKGFPRLRARDG